MFGIEGNFFAAFALLAYVPFALALFAFLPPRKAVIWTFLIALLFLPMSQLRLHGFTDLNKTSAACAGALLGALIFDSPTLFSFRWKIWDIPMLIWSLCPAISSIGNDRGPYDAVSAVAYQVTSWGLPYFLGRVYFNDLKGLRELALAIVAGGLIYVPLCWFEIRMSPQLHVWVYGFHQHDFAQVIRYGGYRPMVFMEHGLAVAMWMAAASLTAFWLWRCGAPEKIFGLRMGWAAFFLIGTSLWLRSLGAECLMIIGLGTLIITGATRLRVWILMLTLIPPTWMIVRSLDIWNGRDLVEYLQQHDEHAADSMRVRFHSERVLADRAMERPVYGWTAWFFLTYEANHNLRSVPDQLWIIAFGQFGLIGLVSLTVSLLLPIWLVMSRIPLQYWKTAGAAAPAALSMLVTLHMCDNLFNAMINPIFVICAGALTGLSFHFQAATDAPHRPFIYSPAAPALPVGRGPATA